MMLFKNEDASLELHIVNYEFPAGGGEAGSDDRNWLVLRCTWNNGEGVIVKDSNSCLLTYELREMAAKQRGCELLCQFCDKVYHFTEKELQDLADSLETGAP